MKKSVSVLLVICIAAGLTASRGRADIPTQTTTATETTTIRETTPEETMPEETTVEETTVYVEETEPSATPEELNAYFQRIRSDAWVEICADPTYATHIRFTNDGGLQVDSKYECDGVCESYGATYQSSDRGYWENKIQYSNETSVMVCFIDRLYSVGEPVKRPPMQSRRAGKRKCRLINDLFCARICYTCIIREKRRATP